MISLGKYIRRMENFNPIKYRGKIEQIVGLTIEAVGPWGNVGELCYINSPEGRIKAEIVGFKGEKTILMPMGELRGVGPGCEVTASGDIFKIGVGAGLKGRILDGLGQPLDGKDPVMVEEWVPVVSSARNPLERTRIQEPLPLGIKAIDGVLTCGKGQRLGIFAGSGVGKSILIGMIARNTEADVNVIALIGERGREVREFIERDLGEEGLERSVVVAATSDQPALVRLKGAMVATAIAEYFRDEGQNVLLMMDSVTRFAMAQREIGLAVGEPPATRGYTPSVFAILPKLLERAGTAKEGTITGLYSVLVDGDDLNEPIADAVRGTLDGHIVLSRDLAAQNHYPAIDVLSSVSRVMIDIVGQEHLGRATRMRSIMATYREAKDMIEIGAYKSGTNPRIDEAIRMYEPCRSFLQQGVFEKFSFQETMQQLERLISEDRENN
ncbi:MAG TPA: flagellar protein export ATPase FliI [Syntrophomonadaceae bacterium]|nr:flagellar protein export ATPase FliI [Syntrophomonadaceae bacterium]